jgi:prepilin-type N-terminal cleavage/methylation domain-containing protein
VVSKYQFAKSAFTMIELIFAIVIIGITVISLPMVNQIVSKGVEGNLVQEAIFASSAEINQVLSYHWDENSIQGNDTLAKVVWTPNSSCDSDTKLRPGHISEPLHRRCIDDNTTGESTTFNDATLNDIDDMNGTTSSIFIDNSGGSVISSSKGYKQDYNSTVNVEYADFEPGVASNNNIKKVTVTISKGGNNITVLRAYSANIGEIDYYKRSYQ